jgi:pimeloyl-ACP methyl ester carboxylesterase
LPAETQATKKIFMDDREIHPGLDAAAIGVSSEPQGGVSVEEHWLELTDGRMRYLKAGSGPPVILVHGMLGYSFSWRFTIPALAPHATVYAIDNLGAGFSTASDGMDCTLRATADRILQFTDALGLQDFDLLGTSHGGGVAIMVAAVLEERCAQRKARADRGEPAGRNHPRLRRLVLVAPINPWSRHGKRLAPFLGSGFGSLLFRNTIERWRALDYLWLSRMFGDEAKIPPDSLEGYRMPVIKNHAMRHGARIARNWTADLAELETLLPTIRDYPTLLIWGTKDRAVHFRSAQPLHRNFSNAQLVVFEGIGHLTYEEAPQEFNRTLVDFLTAGSKV